MLLPICIKLLHKEWLLGGLSLQCDSWENMQNNLRNDTNISAHDGVAVSASNITVGAAAGADVSWASSGIAINEFGWWPQLQYYYGEYFKGILFVLASTTYILAVPAIFTRREAAMTLTFRITKRAVDVFAAIVGLLLTLPVFVVLPILIKLDSPGPVFYTQVRVGQNRRSRDRRYCQRTDVEAD